MSQNNPLTGLLENQPFVVLDGAMATELPTASGRLKC